MRHAWLGTVPYAEAFDLQTALHRARAADEIPDTLLHLEHPHVYTIGRRGNDGDVLWTRELLQQRGVEVFEADRGGMVTYHGPGQLVGYPILHLGRGADVVRYLRQLEETLIRALASYGVDAGRSHGDAGVWVGSRKIAAVGVRVSRFTTKHGYAVNVSSDLSYFTGIVPCGITDRGVTSVLELTGAAPGVEEFASEVAVRFAEVFGRSMVACEPADVLPVVGS